jgi:hypothetical protein
MAKASTKTSVKNGLKELDRISNAGTSKVLKTEKLNVVVRAALEDKDLKQAVMDYIFDGNPESVSPLQEIRDAIA